MNLEHVLWLGGPPGAGKSTAVRKIAHRHGARWYAADLHVWEHRDCLIQEGDPLALEWEAMTPDERLVESSPERLNALLLEAERGPLILDDLDRLPRAPLVLAEGTPLLPSLLAFARPANSLWLMPTRDLQRSRLLAAAPFEGVSDIQRATRNWIARAALVSDIVEQEARRFNGRIIRVDGAKTPDETADEIEAAFGEVLARGAQARTAADRRRLIRYENIVAARHHLAFLTHIPAAGPIDATSYPFSCECAAPSCDAAIPLTVPEFLRAIEIECSFLGHP